jgi:hypothetical protein
MMLTEITSGSSLDKASAPLNQNYHNAYPKASPPNPKYKFRQQQMCYNLPIYADKKPPPAWI